MALAQQVQPWARSNTDLMGGGTSSDQCRAGHQALLLFERSSSRCHQRARVATKHYYFLEFQSVLALLWAALVTANTRPATGMIIGRYMDI